MSEAARPAPRDAAHRKWRMLWLLALAELLAMAVWFSASAVVPALAEHWNLDAGGRAWLTMSVQLGFVCGALGSAALNLSDRWPAHRLFGLSAAGAALATALLPLAPALGPAIALRLATGALLAGVYPVGMKIMATWTREDRGLGIGLLVGALTIGSAAPHLVGAAGGFGAWRTVLWTAAGLAALGALLGGLVLREGPYRTPAPPFDARTALRGLRQPAVALANVGYLGHMWELYAMWAWVPLLLRERYAAAGLGAGAAGSAAFAVVAIGGVGSLVAGKLADRWGRTLVAAAAMAISGACALVAGWIPADRAVLLTALCLIWGLTVVADSAQFSAAVSELAEPAYVGSALTLQTSMGFLLTLATIRLVPSLEGAWGWGPALAALAVGPCVGIVAMAALRRRPEAALLAGGRG